MRLRDKSKNKIEKKSKCCICGEKMLTRYSHNAQPVKKGRCCHQCNIEFVIPKRIENLFLDSF